MAESMKPAVGDHGINSAAENAAKSPNLESGFMCEKVISEENKKCFKPHKGGTAPKGPGVR